MLERKARARAHLHFKAKGNGHGKARRHRMPRAGGKVEIFSGHHIHASGPFGGVSGHRQSLAMGQPLKRYLDIRQGHRQSFASSGGLFRFCPCDPSCLFRLL